MRRFSRRDALRAVGAAAVAGLAGCQTGARNDLCGEEPSPTESTIPTEPLGSVSVPSAAGEWPSYQHDAGRTGFVDAAGPTDGVRLAWTRDVGDAADAWPVVADGTVVVSAGEPGSVMALSPADGEVAWSVGFDHASPPAVVDGRVVVGDRTGLHALDLGDGAERWTFAPEYDPTTTKREGEGGTARFDGAPAYASDTVLARSNLGVHALAPDGTERWRRKRAHLGAVGDDTAYLLGEAGVVAVDVASGEEQWSREGLGVGPEIAVRDGTIYGGDTDSVVAIDAGTGEKQWTFDGESEAFASPTVTPDAVFAASSPKESADGGNLYALDRDTGEAAWCTYVGARAVNAPAATADTVFVPTQNAVEARAADGGDLRWRYAPPDGSRTFQAAAVVDGLLVTGTELGSVLAFADA
jgi:outer membrane protein assembly factor BamB